MGALSFPNVHPHTKTVTTNLLAQTNDKDQEVVRPTMQQTVVNTFLGLALATSVFTFAPAAALAEGDLAPAAETISIAACKKNPTGGATNCISTGNVKQLDVYSPPWTFETSAEEAVARIKGVVAADPYLELASSSENPLYLKVKATRSIFNDNLEFLVNPRDKVVTFRAQQDGEPSVSDFGGIRKELDSIRQRAKLGVMGQGMSADALPSQNGPLGQLKAFYGLQSGQGFEEVFEE